MTKRLKVQLKSDGSDCSDPIRILSFVPLFQMWRDFYGIHIHAAIWLFNFPKAKAARTALNTCKDLPRLRGARPKSKLTSYFQVINYLLAAYATTDNIAGAEMDIISFQGPVGHSGVEYDQFLWIKTTLPGPCTRSSVWKDNFCKERNSPSERAFRATDLGPNRYR